MQKYKIWIIIALVILCLVTLLLWLSLRMKSRLRMNQIALSQPY